jgi:putative DNA primase/helicase
MISNVPEELQILPRWVVWRHSQSKGKVPYQLSGRKADKTNPEHWTTYAEAVTAKGFDGVGFVFAGDGIVGIDLDHCIVDEELLPWAAKIVRDFDTYTEISPSGAGLHLFMLGSWPDPCGQGGRRRDQLEVYWDRAYFTVTGQCWQGTPESLQHRQPQIDALFRRQFAKSERPQAAPPPPVSHTMSADELLEVAFRSSNGARIRQLFDERGAQGNSEGDAALCGLLAFYCRGDAMLLEFIMRRSNRVRTKWDSMRGSETWIRRECRLAVEKHQGEWYTPQFKTAKASATVQPRSSSFGAKSVDRRIKAFRCTDAGNAELFAHLFGNDLRFDWKRERWLRWGGQLWEITRGEWLIRLAKDAARARYEVASLSDDDVQRKWAFGSESKSKIEAALHLTRSEPPIVDPGDAWDQQPMLLGCPNGVVDLRTGAFRPGSRDDYLTQSVAVQYVPQAHCPRWLQFVREVFDGDEELIRFVWRAVGYSLTGSVKEQCFFLLHGKGANGKSVLLSVLRHILGDYAHNASFQLFDYAARNDHTQNLALLEHRRFVTASEAAENARLNEDRLKTLAGSDPISARLMRENDRTFENTAKVWLGVNRRPRVLDDTDGFWRKARLIPFTRQFLGNDADPNLSEKLKTEAAGILRWAVQGAMEWAREGLTPPLVVLAASSAWREQADPLGEFLSSCCVLETTCQASAGDLYLAYCEWCAELQIKERERLSNTAFGTRMADRFTKGRVTQAGRKTTVYFGVGLRGVTDDRQG